MIRFVVYDDSGRIKRVGFCPTGMLGLQAQEGEQVMAGDADLYRHYVLDGAVKEKGDYSLSHLPVPCDVWIDGVRYHCTEQPEFEFDAPGEYVIYVNAGPRFLEKEFRYAHQA